MLHVQIVPNSTLHIPESLATNLPSVKYFGLMVLEITQITNTDRQTERDS